MHRSFIDRLLLPAIFGLSTMIAGLVLWQSLVTHRKAEITAATSEQASFLKTEIESDLEARILPLERLAGRWQASQRPDQQAMQSDASLVMSSYPAYRAIEWVDPTFHVVMGHPGKRKSGQMLAQDLGANATQRATFEETRDTQTTMVTPPTDLHPGVRGFLVCVPVYSEKQLTGYLVGEFRYQDLLSSILQNVASDYWVAVYDGAEEIYRPRARSSASPKTLCPGGFRKISAANLASRSLAQERRSCLRTIAFAWIGFWRRHTDGDRAGIRRLHGGLVENTRQEVGRSESRSRERNCRTRTSRRSAATRTKDGSYRPIGWRRGPRL